jgi:protein required for attachment to host cells
MNMNALIVVADAARARMFRMAEMDDPRSPVALCEVESLVHPESRIKAGERYTGSATSGVRTGAAGPGHRLDDHREAHDREERRRFANSIAGAVQEYTKASSKNPVIVIATHAMHSLLNDALGRELGREIYLRSEIGELSQLSPHQLLAEVSRRGLLQP